jgi:hypothetical protein
LFSEGFQYWQGQEMGGAMSEGKAMGKP